MSTNSYVHSVRVKARYNSSHRRSALNRHVFGIFDIYHVKTVLSKHGSTILSVFFIRGGPMAVILICFNFFGRWIDSNMPLGVFPPWGWGEVVPWQ